MRTRTLLVLLVGLLALGATATVSAQEANETDREETDPDDVPRTVEVRSPPDGITLALQREDEPESDPVEVRFDPPNATMTFRYSPEDDGTQLSVSLEAIVEYTDDNENGTYDFGEPVVSAVPLASFPQENRSEANRTQWSPPIVTNVTQGGSEGKRVLVPAEIAGNASFSVELQAYGNRVRMQNTTLGATSVYVGLAIEGYPFQRQDTGLALFLSVQMDADQTGQQHRSRAENERGFVTSDETEDRSVNMLFAWSTTATVDDRSVVVQTTQMAIESQDDDGQTEENRRRTSDEDTGDRPWQIGGGREDITERYVLSYPRGQQIEQDTKGEVALASVEETDGMPAAGPALASLAIAAAALVFRRETT